MVLTLFPLFLLFLVEGCLCGAHERRLLNDLLHGYIKEARPTSTFDEPVVVVFGLDLQQIIDMDEQNQATIAIHYTLYCTDHKHGQMERGKCGIPLTTSLSFRVPTRCIYKK